MPKVSVIMPVYNEKQFLIDAIKSILEQSFIDFELIIVADKSDMPICALVNSFKDSRIMLRVNEERKGITASLNIGLSMARGEYIARQDSDDISVRTRLFEQVKYLENHPEVGVVGTSCSIINETGTVIDDWEATPNPTNALSSRNKIAHGSVMFRKRVVEEVGKYDEMFKYAQDYDLWLRVSKKSQIRNLPDRLYQLRVHKNAVGQQKAEEQALCVIQAQRKDTGYNNIKPLQYNDLTKEEKIKFHNIVIFNYLQGNNVVQATTEMFKLSEIDPLNPENIVMSLSLFFWGINGVKKVLSVYRRMRALIQTGGRDGGKSSC
jgi:glycosyltransferase involved in cell wall biosynthesis